MARLEKSNGKGEGHYRKRALPLYYAMSRTRANICSVCSNILQPSNPHFSAVSGTIYMAVVAQHSWISRRDFTPVGAVESAGRREEMVNKSPRVGSQGLSGCWFGSIALVCFTIQRRSATLFKYSGCTASSWECDRESYGMLDEEFVTTPGYGLQQLNGILRSCLKIIERTLQRLVTLCIYAKRLPRENRGGRNLFPREQQETLNAETHKQFSRLPRRSGGEFRKLGVWESQGRSMSDKNSGSQKRGELAG
ncbi:hypothetical protein ALC57_12272 [Trachymyrmex cornetzi]|uniref:Uncharacterized protein n=1 Tax=Trachymyrmex cornetzi TaxID=471704 RepID=A0A151J138_9HYME|nr:hypothetical protein ALC57_12272 [Trachymyrmex cornetzi]